MRAIPRPTARAVILAAEILADASALGISAADLASSADVPATLLRTLTSLRLGLLEAGHDVRSVAEDGPPIEVARVVSKAAVPSPEITAHVLARVARALEDRARDLGQLAKRARLRVHAAAPDATAADRQAAETARLRRGRKRKKVLDEKICE